MKKEQIKTLNIYFAQVRLEELEEQIKEEQRQKRIQEKKRIRKIRNYYQDSIRNYLD